MKKNLKIYDLSSRATGTVQWYKFLMINIYLFFFNVFILFSHLPLSILLTYTVTCEMPLFRILRASQVREPMKYTSRHLYFFKLARHSLKQENSRKFLFFIHIERNNWSLVHHVDDRCHYASVRHKFRNF